RIGMDGKIEMKSFSSEIIKQHCVFEHIYFARPDSQVFSKNVHKMRYEMGKQLAREYSHIKADIVVAVPDSGVSSAMGFASESGIPMDRGLIRNHYVGRSFIQPTQKERMDLVKMKLRPVLEVIEGKEIALIDDSMVRGTTANAIIKLIKAKNVKKIHYFIASPPIKYSCYFGVDTPDREKLIANKMTPKELAEHFGIASVNYLPVEGLKRILKENANDYCFACFAGNYIMENENG
ncbi:amidophosphoribosyltransferase, partial [bacterium]|nr:amidophosphoribosyltransferase [bacterium]